jgi:four helix bundle protein
MEGKINSYRDLIVWQKAMDLVVQVYEMTGRFPKEEQYGLTSQMRKAAISIVSKISEGSYRGSRKDFRHFILIAYGSGGELEAQLEITSRLEFASAPELERISTLHKEVMKMLNSLSQKLAV